MIKYEVFKSEEKKPRTYVVAVDRILNTCHFLNFTKEAKRYFKYSWAKLEPLYVWVIGDDLFLENPHKKGQKKRVAVTTIRRKCK